MEFLFVDGKEVSNQSRRLIRSHVMKGKNLGKTIHRPSRRSPARATTTQAVQFVTKAPETQQQNARTGGDDQDCLIGDRSPGETITDITFPVGHRFSSVGLPIEVNPYMRRFITHCKPSLTPQPFQWCYLTHAETSLHHARGIFISARDMPLTEPVYMVAIHDDGRGFSALHPSHGCNLRKMFL